MIRFCDQEVCCVFEDDLNRGQIITYFLNGHRNELVCVLTREGEFAGSIAYGSLLGNEIEDAIRKDYVILDDDIWKNGRKYFRGCKRDIGKIDLLPVLNREGQLICFAWQDDEANRELRMLDELEECGGALDFRDVFPEYDCVTVYGFNELAYYFVRYLEKIGMPVRAAGAMWDEFNIQEAEDVLDYKNFKVYAEGQEILEKEIGLRGSVSAEFECIDRIYEENICRGMIRNADMEVSDFLEYLRGKRIAILGTHVYALNAFDLLLKYGLNINYFISDETENIENELFGKRIISSRKLMGKTEKIVCLEPCAKHSAWGFGNTDLYHYMGYKRNKEFFLLQDYVEVPNNGWLNIIKYSVNQLVRRIVLVGDYWLCVKLNRILEMQNQYLSEKVFYFDVLEDNKERVELKKVNRNEIEKTDICLLLISQYYTCYADKDLKISYREWLKKKYETNLSWIYIIDYPIENTAFMKNMIFPKECPKPEFKVKKIVIGSINFYSGNTLLRGILDGHAEILMLDYGYLNDNLYDICIRLALVKNTDILSLLWKIIRDVDQYNKRIYGFYAETWEEDRVFKFNKCMEEMLSAKESFTSQELFVIIHIAYAKSWGKVIVDISNIIIYWEPHMWPGGREELAVWLSEAAFSGSIINIVRNAYIRAGSELKNYSFLKYSSVAGRGVFYAALRYPNEERKEYDGWKRIIVRFEDLKCNPEIELRRLCNEWGIEWSDTLLETTLHGKIEFFSNVTGFDLAPVYRTYEEYLSAFDRFRISLITGPWQKQYGYPFVSSVMFSRRELQEMFYKEFRFQKMLAFQSREEKITFTRWVRRLIADCLWTTRSKEIMDKNSGQSVKY